MDATPDVADMMRAYAQDAIDHARVAAGISLDYSPESIEHVEAILDRLHANIPRGFSRVFRRGPSADDMATVAKMYGGYIGEVIRRAAGGEWLLDRDTAPGETVIALRKGGQRIFPPAKVHKRLANGAEDNVWVYYRVLTQEHWK